jgi:hypothetical protein
VALLYPAGNFALSLQAIRLSSIRSPPGPGFRTSHQTSVAGFRYRPFGQPFPK